ncbi:MAG: amidohydrolase [Parabacteroides distasonis]|nr:amidohydrolase [Parabacteroides distasonis]
MSILIKGVWLNDRIKDVYIQENRIQQIGECLEVQADQVIDGKKKALIPGFVNAHTHAAMTLFRGFGDDMPLKAWLEEKIWPNEAKLTSEDVYWGTKLACLEMIKSGTTTFFDMYHKFSASAKAIEEMGLRALLAGACFDHFNSELRERGKQAVEKLYAEAATFSDRIQYAAGPHAIYTVSGELLQWIHAFAEEHQIPIHLHLAETEGEVQDSVKQFGLTPVRYLYQLGILSPRLILAHGLYVDEEEIQMLADQGVTVVHNPASNMKLASGYRFKYSEMKAAGVRVALGTDGCSSSNNLDMVEAMKLASLLGKAWRKEPEAVTAKEIFHTATLSGAEAIHLKAGQIAEGFLADLCLVDLRMPAFTPNHNFISNLVYAANGSCIDTVICNGKILMQDRKVPGEEEIMEKAADLAYKLVAVS